MSEQQADGWHYIDAAGAQRGPITRDVLQQLAQRGDVRRESPLWRMGMPNWSAASLVMPAIFEGLPPSPPVTMAYAHPAAPPIGENAGVRLLIPIGRSGWAIAAGYLGLFSIIPIFAPVALIISIIALRDLKRHPESHGAGRAWFGLVMGILFTILLCIGAIAIAAGK